MIQSFKRLWPYLRPYGRDLTLMFLLGLGVTLVGGTVPVIVKWLFAIYERKDLELLQQLPAWVHSFLPPTEENRQAVARVLPLVFPALFFCYGLLRYLHYSLLNYTAERVIAGVRMDLVRKVLRLNLTYHGSLERGSGGLISRVFNDTNLLQQGLNFYADLIREPIQAMIFLAYMLREDWKLTLLALLFLPFFILVTKQVGRSLRKYGNLGRESMEDLTATLKESVDGVRVVQSFNLESEMVRRFEAHLRQYLGTAKKIVMREQAVSPVNEFAISFLLMGFAYYSIQAVMHEGMSGASFISYVVAAGLLQAPIKKLQDASVKIQQSVVVTERVFSILESRSEVPETKSPRAFPKNWKEIKFRNVSFSYGGELNLKDINLTIKRGEVIALVGESGSGKSTLVNLLERFYDPTQGEILIDDTPLGEFRLSELRANVALVTQDVFLFRDSIARNVQAGDFSKDASGVEAAARLANAHTFISATTKGYESPVGERGSFLSGGEKQRVSIARAIFKDASILILDEATSALDSVSEMEVQKGLNHLMEGRTAFVIAHRLSTVFNADRILVMKKGEIVEEGTHDELLAKGGEYHNFFQLQTKIS
jgi:ATP-binding cassette subfamily B protein/subfamily B ATP-binding cassette protein MsbA